MPVLSEMRKSTAASGADDPAGAAGDGDAAEQRGGQRLELEILADIRAGAAEPGGGDHRGEAGEQPARAIEDGADAVDRDAGEPRARLVGAERIEPRAGRREAERGRGDEIGRHDERDEMDRQEPEGAAAEAGETGADAADRRAAGQRDREAGIDIAGAEGGDQRHDAEAGDQHAVDETEDGSDGQPRDDPRRHAEARLEDGRHRKAGEAHHAADREVDAAAAGEDDEALAERDQSEDGRELKDARHRARAEEAGQRDCENGEQDRPEGSEAEQSCRGRAHRPRTIPRSRPAFSAPGRGEEDRPPPPAPTATARR